MFHCSESTIRNQLLRGRKILQKNSTYGAKSMLLPAAVLAGRGHHHSGRSGGKPGVQSVQRMEEILKGI